MEELSPSTPEQTKLAPTLDEKTPVRKYKKIIVVAIIVILLFSGTYIIANKILPHRRTPPSLSFKSSSSFNLPNGKKIRMKQFINNTFNYSLEYPESCTVTIGQDKSGTFHEENVLIYVCHPESTSVALWMNIVASDIQKDQQALASYNKIYNSAVGNILSASPNETVEKAAKIKIDGNDAVKYFSTIQYSNGNIGYYVIYIIKRDNILYKLTMTPNDNHKQTLIDYLPLYDYMIISSFHFTN